MQTSAAVLRGPGDWHVVDLEVRDPGPGQVMVDPAFAGPCQCDGVSADPRERDSSGALV